jgi:hypothetical protein
MGEAEIRRSEEPTMSKKGEEAPQLPLRPRATWITKGDARPDEEADAEWQKANALLFGPSYEAWHKKDKFSEKVKNLERKLAEDDWQNDEQRRKRNSGLLESTLKDVTDSSDRLAIKILLLEDEIAQNNRLKRQRASRKEVIRQRKADKRLRQKKERERGIPTIKAPGKPPQQENEHEKSMSKLRKEIKDLEERKRIESAVSAFKRGAQGESMGSEDSDSSSEEESSSSSSRFREMSETSWDGDPNTPHPENPYSRDGEIKYARQRVLDMYNASADEIRPPPCIHKPEEKQESSSVLPTPPPFCSVEDTKRKQQEEWDYYQKKADRNSEKECRVVMAHSDAEELDYLLLIKVKKGEKRFHVRYLLNTECNEYQGPFDLDSKVHHLIQYHNRVFPGQNDKWTITPENELSKEGLPVMQPYPYQGFTKGLHGTGGKKITLQELLESERKKKWKDQAHPGPWNDAIIPRFGDGTKSLLLRRRAG